MIKGKTDDSPICQDPLPTILFYVKEKIFFQMINYFDRTDKREIKTFSRIWVIMPDCTGVDRLKLLCSNYAPCALYILQYIVIIQ